MSNHLKLSTCKHFPNSQNSTILQIFCPVWHRVALTDDDDHGRRSPSVRRCRSVEPRSYYYRLVKAETASVTAAAVATEVDISTIAAAASYGWGRHGFLLCALSDFRGSPLPFSMALRRREGYQRRRSAASSIAEAAFAFASAAA